MVFVPIISILFTIYAYSNIKSYYRYLELRGLKKSSTKRSIGAQFGSLLSLNISLAIAYMFATEMVLWQILEKQLFYRYFPSITPYLIAIAIPLGIALILFSIFALEEKKFTPTEVS